MSGEFRWPGGKRAAVSLSFDDARVSQADNGLAILDEYGIKATFYAGVEAAARRLAAWRRALRDGHEIGNHTLSHFCSGNFAFSRGLSLEELTLDRIEADIEEADRRIEELFGVRTQTFAYPCGQTYVGRGAETASYVPVVARRFLAGRGYRNESHNAPRRGDLAQLCAFPLDTDPCERFIDLIERAEQDGGYIVFCGHEVGTQGFQNIEERKLRTLCAYLAERREWLWTDTICSVAAHIAAELKREQRSDPEEGSRV